MNYEKWPFNLGFSQFNRCILLSHFHLWFFDSSHSLHTYFNFKIEALIRWIINWLSLLYVYLESVFCSCELNTDCLEWPQKNVHSHITFQMHTYRCQWFQLWRLRVLTIVFFCFCLCAIARNAIEMYTYILSNRHGFLILKWKIKTSDSIIIIISCYKNMKEW